MPSEDTRHELLILSCSLTNSLVLGMEISCVLPVGAVNCGQCTGCELSRGVLQQLGCAGQGLAQSRLVHPMALEMRMAVRHLKVGCVPSPGQPSVKSSAPSLPWYISCVSGCDRVLMQLA